MYKITNVKLTDCTDSLFIRTMRMHYVQDGVEKTWDLMKVHNSVAVVVYNVTRKVLIFVRQFRPAVYLAHVSPEDIEHGISTEKYPPSLGMTVELCAGIVDKDQSLVETARDEIFEECGYDVPLSKIQKVTSYRSGVAITGAVQTMFYAEVTDQMRVSRGGGNAEEGELIEVVEMPLMEAKAMIFDENIARSQTTLFGLLWFFNKDSAPKLMHNL